MVTLPERYGSQSDRMVGESWKAIQHGDAAGCEADGSERTEERRGGRDDTLESAHSFLLHHAPLPPQS